MPFLKLPNQLPVKVDKPIFSVGYGADFDLCLLKSTGQLLFSIHQEDSRCHLIPVDVPIFINGRRIRSNTPLSPCDRIEWKTGTLVFLDETGIVLPHTNTTNTLFETLADQLANIAAASLSPHDALWDFFSRLVKISGAERGFLLAEVASNGNWQVVVSAGKDGLDGIPHTGQKELLSQTILKQALETRKSVHIESLVGHPWAQNTSLMGAKVYSICCVPLLAENRVIGAVYFDTHTPGRSINKDATRWARFLSLPLALYFSADAERRKYRSLSLSSQSSPFSFPFVFDASIPDHPMSAVVERIMRLASTDLSILIDGETGTGKELVARAIHEKSKRCKGPFVSINCGAIPPTLVESTLFGHVKGAFTGALRDFPGKFRQACGGTLFLDEIGDLPLELQVKLLRVLQEKVVEPLGALEAKPVDFRLIAATHASLEVLIQNNQFRKDLFYRLNGGTIHVPTLNERKSDIILLSEVFLTANASSRSLSEGAKSKLMAHTWPGNIRELEQTILRAAALATSEYILETDIEISGVEESRIHDVSSVVSPPRNSTRGLKAQRDTFSSDTVYHALEKHSGNRTRAAAELGISERTLYRLLQA